MLEHWIWLATRPNVTDRLKYQLLITYSDIEAVYSQKDICYRDVPGMTAQAEKSLNQKSMTDAEKILKQCREKNVGLLTFLDEKYPYRLKEIYDPPVLLYYLGTLPEVEDQPVIGAVGTRKCSDYGVNTAAELGYQISRCGALVASGMAEGIDAAVLEGVLAAGGNPVIFLAGGVDVVYPACNRYLYDKIRDRGCIFSENPPGTRPSGWLFPKRNRMISGISNGVLVVEAPERSGALITARCALDQGRDLFTIPSPIHSPSGKGTNALLRDGAMMVQEGWDVVGTYQYLYPDAVRCIQGSPDRDTWSRMDHKAPQNSGDQNKKHPSGRTKTKKNIDNCATPPYSDVERKPVAKSPQEQAIIDQLLQGPKPADAVITGSALPYAQAMSVITMLEVRGVIERRAGNLLGLNNN